ncbi:competence type IV pilus assembly protein ComGB [Robertmurraya andreesenii]|uniref:Competence protein ComGB n=1 Tax=Anoxybacillus andreesenii TaxID=1325932 RepID=A0ABT9V629_9BACL|nr:competence type IV pilus assembly protein ComGB [Robertmurraya andreesenii]MDQ0156401.1 competence protein ComGB [Robertmurraya andreesenii]
MRSRKWKLKEQADFLKRTGDLLARGYPLAEAIHSVTYQMSETRKEEIRQSLDDLKEGYPLHKILFDLGFNQTLVGFVYFAEQHGSLADAFRDGSEMMLKREGDADKLKKIMIYPLLLMVMTLFLFVFVEKILLPQYTSLFQSMNLSPNVFMKIVYVTGEIFPLFLLLFMLLLYVGLSYYFLRFKKYSPIKQRRIMVSIPYMGAFSRLYTTHYFSIQLSYLLGGGLSILEALKLFEEHEKHSFDRQLGREMQDHLSTGESFAEIVKRYPFFEEDLIFIVKHGQENGKLEQELLFFSKYCLEKLQNKMDKMFKTIQPILYSLIGMIVVSMYLAILLPMFQLLDGF